MEKFLRGVQEQVVRGWGKAKEYLPIALLGFTSLFFANKAEGRSQESQEMMPDSTAPAAHYYQKHPPAVPGVRTNSPSTYQLGNTINEKKKPLKLDATPEVENLELKVTKNNPKPGDDDYIPPIPNPPDVTTQKGGQ